VHQEEDNWPITVKLPEPSVEDPEVSATEWIGLFTATLKKIDFAHYWIAVLTTIL
jgi:hypothetical protein